MRTDIPRVTGKLAKLGDVVFVGRDPVTDIPAAITFTRGNVRVSVASVGGRNIDVLEIAAKMDHFLSDTPTKAAIENVRVSGLGNGRGKGLDCAVSGAIPREIDSNTDAERAGIQRNSMHHQSNKRPAIC